MTFVNEASLSNMGRRANTPIWENFTLQTARRKGCPNKMVQLYKETRMLQEPHAGDSGSHCGKSWWHEEDPSQRRAWRICRGFSPGLLSKKHSHTCLNTASFQQRGKGFQTAQLCYCNHTAQAKLDRVALFSRIRFYKLHSSGAPLRCYAEVSGIVSITNKSLCSKFMLDGNLASKS